MSQAKQTLVRQGETGAQKRRPRISQIAAMRLLLKYQQRLIGHGVKAGASKLENEIRRASRSFGHAVTRHDLDKWFSGRTQALGNEKMMAIEAFIATPDFMKIVPEAKGVLFKREQAIDIGTAFAQVYGYEVRDDLDSPVSELTGLWRMTPTEMFTEGVDPGTIQWHGGAAFVLFQPLQGYGFSVAHIIYGKRVPDHFPDLYMSGFLFQKQGSIELKLMDRFDRSEWKYRLVRLADYVAHEPSENYWRSNGDPLWDERYLLLTQHAQDPFAEVKPWTRESLSRKIVSQEPFKNFRPIFTLAGTALSFGGAFYLTRCVDRNGKLAAFHSEIEKTFDEFLWNVLPNEYGKIT